MVSVKESRTVVPPGLFDEFFHSCGMGSKSAQRSFQDLRVRYDSTCACALDSV